MLYADEEFWKPDPENPFDKAPGKMTVVMLDLAILKVEIETGIYKAPIQVLAEDFRSAPLPPEIPW